MGYFQNLLDKINGKNRYRHLLSELSNLGKSQQDLLTAVTEEEAQLRCIISEFLQQINSSNEFQKQQIRSLSNSLGEIQQRIKSFNEYIRISFLAREVHSNVFPKYRNCNRGKDIVILAAGPTLDYYNIHQNALYLGVNRVFLSNKADLDYIFIQDYIPEIQDDLDGYKGNNCKKFYGVHYLVPGIAQKFADRANAERYYFVDLDYESVWAFPHDISLQPFNTYSSVIHPAVTFALWTGVSKIYIVGCDTNLGGYSKQLRYANSNTNALSVDNVIYGWKRMKDYVEIMYPDSEIISVNPIGLKGMFRDMYTLNFLQDHPEINKNEVEILQ